MTDTVLLEKDVLAAGSTGRSQAILRMHYSNEVTIRMALESLKVFRDFEGMVGSPSGYVRTGYFLIVREADRSALEDNVAMQRRIGVDARVVSAVDAMEVAPALCVESDEALAYEPDSGYADPYSVTTGYARRARELGAQVMMNTEVTGIEVTGGRVAAVVTPQGKIQTPVAVVAAGPWSRPVLGRLGVDVPLRPLRHQVIALRRPEAEVPDHPILGDVVYSLSARPDVGHLTLVGVGEDEFVEPDDYNQGVDMPVVEETFTNLARRMPCMSQALYRGGWSGLFTTTPDWHPILGGVNGIQGLYCAVGFSGHGFKLSPMIGVAVAEIVTQGRATTIDTSMLGLDRFEEGRPMTSRYGMSVLA
jgi:sarcosine oxidase subunit beta